GESKVDVAVERPREQPRIGAVHLRDELRLYEPDKVVRNTGGDLAALPFEPAEGVPRPWRKVKVEATARSLRVWRYEEKAEKWKPLADLDETALKQPTETL